MIINGDALTELKKLPAQSVNCCVTSPPYYGLRDYGTGTWVGGDPSCEHKGTPIRTREHINENYGQGWSDVKNKLVLQPFKAVCPLCGAVREDKQIGLEETPEEYIDRLVDVFREVKRVLKDDGTLWVNIGDSYWGSGSRGFDFTDKFTEASKIQNGSQGTINLANIPKLVGNYKDIKNKDLIGIPWMLAFALRNDGWYLRQDIIWAKPNPMPESVTDRCTKSHEYIFLLSKNHRYYFDHEAIQEQAVGNDRPRVFCAKDQQGTNRHEIGNVFRPKHKNLQYNGQQNHTMHERRADGLPDIKYSVRNKRDVWNVPVAPVKEAHFATFPEKLIEPCILAGCPIGGVVLDPFFGSGTTGRVAVRLNRHYIGCELNPEYIEIANRRTDNVQLSFEGLI